MKTIHCKVCHKDIGIYGWPSHVAKEKRIHGNDIFKVLKQGEIPEGPIDKFPNHEGRDSIE